MKGWGAPLGTVTFGPTVLHDLRSVTKSLVGMLYGIALADGKVPPPEARLYDQFPEYPDLASQPGRDRITVAHALSMTMGTEWDEMTFPYSDPRNSENAMEAAPDRYRYILSLPIVGEPGVKWTYCGGATALLGRLIAKGTGEKLTDYARRVLFDPLGLGPVEWSTDRRRRAARRLGRAPASTRSVARRPDGAGERRLAGQADRPGRVAQAVDNSRRHHRGCRAATAGTGISASFPSARRVTPNPRSAPSAGAGSACSSCRRSTSRSP